MNKESKCFSNVPPEENGQPATPEELEEMRKTGKLVSLKTSEDVKRYYSAKKEEELNKPPEEQNKELLEHFDFYIQHPEKRLQTEATPEQLKDLMPNEAEIQLALQEQGLEDTSENRFKLQKELFSSREYLNWKKMVVDLCRDSLSSIHSSAEKKTRGGEERRYFPTDDQLLATVVERLFYKEIWGLRTLPVTETSQRLRNINYGFSAQGKDYHSHWNKFTYSEAMVESTSERTKAERERIEQLRYEKYEERADKLKAFQERKRQEGKELGTPVAFVGRGEALGLLLKGHGRADDIEKFINSSAYFRKIEKDGLRYRDDYGGSFEFSNRPAEEEPERKQEREEINAMLPELNYLAGGLETIKKEMQPWEEDVRYGRKPESSDPEELKKLLLDRGFHQDFQGFFYDAETEIDDKKRKTLKRDLEQGRRDVEKESAVKKEARSVKEKEEKIENLKKTIESLTSQIKDLKEWITRNTRSIEENNAEIKKKEEEKIREEKNKGLFGKPKNPEEIRRLTTLIAELKGKNKNLLETVEKQNVRLKEAETEQQQALAELKVLTEQK